MQTTQPTPQTGIRRYGLLVSSLSGVLILLALWASLHGPAEAASARAPAVEPGDVVINEVAWGGTAASYADEWIELYNTTGTTVTLDGWHLVDDDDLNLVLAGEVPPHGYYLIERTDDSTVSDVPADLTAPFGSGLANTGETLTLTDGLGTVIDTANGDGGDWPEGTGTPDHRTMERIDPTASDADANWCANDGLTRNGHDADGNPINGTPKARNSCYIVPGLALFKEGPAFATPGLPLTYRLLVSNTGDLAIPSVVLTDRLPAGLTFVTQTSPFSFTRLSSRTLVWDLGDLPGGTLHLITLTVHVAPDLTGTLINVATATEQAGRTSTASWAGPLLPHVRLYALEPVNYGNGGEAAALINQGPYTVTLSGWCLDDRLSSTSRACLPAGARIGPGRILWLAQDGDGFYTAWGFDADWASTAAARPVPLLEGSWPGFTDSGEAVYLLDDAGRPVDVLAYGTGSAETGWTGPAVPYPYAGHAAGQVLYRKLDEATGLPVPDTDTAADWAQDPEDPVDGRKLRYPGWDLETFFFPAVATSTAPVTLAVAPEGSLSLVSQTLASARESILIEAYTFESVPLYEVISRRLQAGVAVTVLLEGGPVGWSTADRKTELWIAERIHNHPNGAVYFLYSSPTRYLYQHAKFAVVDGEVALVSTENFGSRGMPSDRKENGTQGHRGFVVAVRSPDVAARLRAIFARDCDPARHADLVPYGVDPFVLDDPNFLPLPDPDWTTYSAPFTAAVATAAADLTVLQAPENALRDRDGLLGLLLQAGPGDAVAGMQMSEPYTWTDGAGDVGLNPRLQALVTAARQGASVRLLLDGYYDDGNNTETCMRLNRIADQEGLDLACRLGNVAGLGIHAKTFLVALKEGRWIHLGSINGTETSNKRNREVAIQFRSTAAYDRAMEVFENDWAQARAPLVHHIFLPWIARDYVPPADHPLISEVFINPTGLDAGHEWVELYNPGRTLSIGGWTLGDALAAGDYGDGRYAFPREARLLHDQAIVIAACATHFSAEYGFNPDYEWTNCDPTVPDLSPVGSWEGFGLALGNDQDEVLLLGADGARVDSVAWGGSTRAGVVPYPLAAEDTFPFGASLKRYPPDADRDDCSRDFYISWNPSPRNVAGR